MKKWNLRCKFYIIRVFLTNHTGHSSFNTTLWFVSFNYHLCAATVIRIILSSILTSLLLLVQVLIISLIALINLSEICILEVFSVQIEVFVLLSIEAPSQQTSDQSKDNRHAQGTERTCHLQSALLMETIG